MTDSSLVGIGLPTHDGERYLAEALESLLAQDYGNIEIVVSPTTPRATAHPRSCASSLPATAASGTSGATRS